MSGKIARKRDKLHTHSGRPQNLSCIQIKQQKNQRIRDDRRIIIDLSLKGALHDEFNSRRKILF
jgi:hypothetical protein